MTRLALALVLASCASPLPYPAPPYEVGGVVVDYVEDTRLDTPAAATWLRGVPTVLWSPFTLERLGGPVVAFVVAHEVCHLRDWDGGELAADCCAVREVDPSAAWLLAIVVEVETWRGDATHPTGVERAGRIMECAGTD